MSTKNYLTHTKKYKAVLNSVHAIYRLINSTLYLKNLLPRLAKLICQILNADYCAIDLFDTPKTHSLMRARTSTHTKVTFSDKKIPLVKSSIEQRIARKGVWIFRDLFLAVPLLGEDVMGSLVIRRNKDKHTFDSFEKELLTCICEQAVITIKNLQLYEEQQRLVLGSIKSLVSLLDTKTPFAYTHSPYFSRLVLEIARQMHLREEEMKTLEYASFLHDAGKIDIPLSILTKTTKLTGYEYRLIKSHPLKAVQILKPLQILKPAIPIVLHHHERYDGSGYPSRLKKGKIPLGARIMAVADAFDAMTYGRPYRERMPVEEAMQEIEFNSGTQFDPVVVEAFKRALKVQILKKYLKNIR